MPLLMRRNSNEDPWFSFYTHFINVGDTVELVRLQNESGRSAEYPPEIYVKRKGSNNEYLVSLNCFDYIKEEDRDSSK